MSSGRGELCIPFDTPVDLGELPLIRPSERTIDGSDRFFFRDSTVTSFFQNWMATVHLFRLDTNACCCIHETTEFLYKGRGYNDFSARYMVSQRITAEGEIHLNSTTSSSTHGGWDLTETGQYLTRRIQKHAADRVKERNLHLQLKLPSTIRLMEGYRARFEAKQLKVQIKNFSDLDPRYGHGVTMLHLLNELRVWDY
jgi:hypothetical protein